MILTERLVINSIRILNGVKKDLGDCRRLYYRMRSYNDIGYLQGVLDRKAGLDWEAREEVEDQEDYLKICKLLTIPSQTLLSAVGAAHVAAALTNPHREISPLVVLAVLN